MKGGEDGNEKSAGGMEQNLPWLHRDSSYFLTITCEPERM
jgi:hypothetical protein